MTPVHSLFKNITASHCVNISKAKLGKKLTAEHCVNISKAKPGENLPATHRAKLDANFCNNDNKQVLSRDAQSLHYSKGR